MHDKKALATSQSADSASESPCYVATRVHSVFLLSFAQAVRQNDDLR